MPPNMLCAHKQAVDQAEGSDDERRSTSFSAGPRGAAHDPTLDMEVDSSATPGARGGARGRRGGGGGQGRGGAGGAPSAPLPAAPPSERRQQRVRELQRFYAGQFMHPEWMCDLPGDWPSGWLAGVRPEGTRCLVVAFRGITLSRKVPSCAHAYPELLPDSPIHLEQR